jgi:integrase
MFNMAVEWGWLKESSCARIKKLKGEVQRMRYLNREEISRLVESAADTLKPVIIVAVSTGMHRGEIFNMQ